MTHLSFHRLLDLTHGRFGVIDAPCPLCAPERRSAVNRNRKTLRLWRDDPSRITYHCARCEVHGWASAGENSTARRVDPAQITKIKADIVLREAAHCQVRLIKAVSLWRRHVDPAPGTPVHAYLRQARSFAGRIPATIGYLPASRDFPPAMVTAIGIAHETEPGKLAIDEDAIRGVHLTSLTADGLGKAGTDRDKIMIGRSIGSPIVLASPNDGLGLAITEGIEDALSVHEATGLGAWAAGSASRMPALAAAVPDYIECVTIVADADDAGVANARKLGDGLAERRFDVRLIAPSNHERAA